MFSSAKALLTGPDGGSKGYFGTIGEAIAAAAAGDTIRVSAGIYRENITVSKKVSIIGAGAGTTKIIATDANSTPLIFDTNDAVVSGFTLTHEYTADEIAAWSFNNNGVIFRHLKSGNILENCIVTLNRNGIYLNNCQNNTIRNNIIANNRTGINATNNINGTVISGNDISNNWTIGLVYYGYDTVTDFSTVTVSGNTFEENWYTEVLIKDTNATGALDVTNNTFKDTPVTYTTSADASLNEPSYEMQKPEVAGINGPNGKPSEAFPTLRIYNSAAAQLKYDKEKTLIAGAAEPYKTFFELAAKNDGFKVQAD